MARTEGWALQNKDTFRDGQMVLTKILLMSLKSEIIERMTKITFFNVGWLETLLISNTILAG